MQFSENRGIRGRFSSTAEQRQDESGYPAYSQNSGVGRPTLQTGLSSVQWKFQLNPFGTSLSTWSEQEEEEDETNMPSDMNPKTPSRYIPGFPQKKTSHFIFFSK